MSRYKAFLIGSIPETNKFVKDCDDYIKYNDLMNHWYSIIDICALSDNRNGINGCDIGNALYGDEKLKTSMSVEDAVNKYYDVIVNRIMMHPSHKMKDEMITKDELTTICEFARAFGA